MLSEELLFISWFKSDVSFIQHWCKLILESDQIEYSAKEKIQPLFLSQIVLHLLQMIMISMSLANKK